MSVTSQPIGCNTWGPGPGLIWRSRVISNGYRRVNCYCTSVCSGGNMWKLAQISNKDTRIYIYIYTSIYIYIHITKNCTIIGYHIQTSGDFTNKRISVKKRNWGTNREICKAQWCCDRSTKGPKDVQGLAHEEMRPPFCFLWFLASDRTFVWWFGVAKVPSYKPQGDAPVRSQGCWT